MEEPGRLNDFFDSIESTSDDARLDWEKSGVIIREALAKKKKKRRALLWWWTGIGSMILLLFVALILADTDGIDNSNSQQKISNNENNIPPIEKAKIIENKANDRLSIRQNSEITSVRTFTEVESEATESNDANAQILTESSREFELDSKFSDHDVSNNSKRISNQSTRIYPDKTDLKTTDDSMNSDRSSENLNQDVLKISRSDELLGAEKINRLISNITTIERLIFFPELIEKRIPNQPLILNSKEEKGKFEIELWAGNSINSIHEQLPFAEVLNAVDLELSLKRNLNESWFISAGLGYGEDRFQVSFNEESDINIYKPGTVDTIYQYWTGETREVLRDSIPGLRKRSFSNTNVIRNITIPVHIGYKFSLGKFTLAPQVGVAPSLYRTNQSKIASQLYEVTDYDDRKSLSFALTYRVGLTAGLDLGRSQFSIRYLMENNPEVELRGEEINRYTSQVFQIGYGYRF